MTENASPPAQIDAGPVANRLHSAAVHLLRRIRRTDEATGLSPARLSLLSVLVFGGPATISELAHIEQVSVPSMSRLVAALEADGLVERASDPADRRLVFIGATKQGASLMLKARRDRVDYLARRLQELPVTDLRRLGEAAEIMERVFE